MKKNIILLAIAATAAALSLNVNAANPRRALVGTRWAAPAIVDAREEVATGQTSLFLLLEFGPGGQARAQYCERLGIHRGAVERGPSFPLRYKVKQAKGDGTVEIILKGKITDASSAVYKTRPRRTIETATGVYRGNTLDCGLGVFEKIL